MRKTKRVMLLAFVIMISAMSCNSEELFIEPVGEEVINLEDEEEVLEEEEQAEEDASLPCDFDLNTIAPNSTIRINCIMDLDGATISVPANVSILYEGGDIINGTLNFSDNTIISGELLNSTLTLSGSNPQLKDPVFNFIPPRWDIVEGEVPQDVANRNTLIINEILIKVKAMGASNFKLDKLDAYFYGDLKHRGGIEIPSNMNFEMTDKTHLRAHVTAGFRSLIFLGEKENIVISGGNLHGNRNIPGFDPYVSGGQSLIVLKTGINVTMENIHLSNSANDGINIESMKHAYEVDYVPTRNILINGCTFNSNRRNNLSITDGLDMVVENCTFLNAGIDMQYSTGSAPRYAIDLEPHIKDINKPLQHLEHVTLRNNVERGSVAGGIVFADGDYYVFENNDFEGGAHIVGAANVQIINNKIGKRGITHGDDPGGWYTMMRNENNVVAGNTITGEGNGGGIGINAVNKGLEIYDNHIIDMGVGILIRGLRDSHIYNNLIESNGLNDDGINGLFFMDNVLIEDNVIKVKDFPFYIDGVNVKPDEINYSFTFKNNNIESGTRENGRKYFGFINNTQGINFIKNTMNVGLRLGNTKNVLLNDNVIKAGNPFSIEIGGNSIDYLTISNNVIENTDNAGFGHGIIGSISSQDNKNIIIEDNRFSITGTNNGINLRGFNGITVKDNSGYIEARPLIKYEGNNSVFTNNIRLNEGSEIENEIEGTNNTIN